jgi:hypothetical protein
MGTYKEIKNYIKKIKKKEEREILLSVEPCLFSKGHYTNLIKNYYFFF